MSPTAIAYRRKADLWQSNGRPSRGAGGFVVGSTRPTVDVGSAFGPQPTLRTAAQLGLPTQSNGDIVVDDAYHAANKTGSVLEIVGLDLFGFLKIRTRYDVVLRSYRIRGSGPVTGATRTALVDCNHPELGLLGRENVLLEDGILIPDYPSEGIDGVVGHDFTIRRARIENAVDFGGSFNSYRPGDPARVAVEGCFGTSLAYYSPCSYQSDNRTHNDGWQIQGNSGHRLRGNDFRAKPSTTTGNGSNPTDASAPAKNPYGPASVTGQCVGITPNVSVVSDVVIEDNWFAAGRASVIVAENTYPATGVTVRRNKFDRTQPLINVAGVSARRAMIVEPTVSVVGAPSLTGPDTQGNVYEDDATPITVYRMEA